MFSLSLVKVWNKNNFNTDLNKAINSSTFQLQGDEGMSGDPGPPGPVGPAVSDL